MMNRICRSYLMYKLDSVLEDWEESWETEMCDLLHHRIRVHLKTPAGNSKHAHTIMHMKSTMLYIYSPYNKGNARGSSWHTQGIMECRLLPISR